MGCWNGTCGASQLPIYESDQVIGFIVKERGLKQLNGGGSCYPDFLFAPMTIGIKGCYNGYGGIEAIQNEAMILPQIQYAFKKGKLLFDPESQESFPEDVNTLTLEQFISLVERGAIYSKGYNFLTGATETYQIGLMMVLTEVVASLRQQELIKKQVDCQMERVFREARDYQDSFDMLPRPESVDGYAPMVHLYGVAGHLSSYWSYYLRLAAHGEVLDELFQALEEVEEIHAMLEQLRRSWMPQTGAGSQDDDELHGELAQITLRRLERLQKELDEY